MKITLEDDEDEITLTNEGLRDGYITIICGDKEADSNDYDDALKRDERTFSY